MKPLKYKSIYEATTSDDEVIDYIYPTKNLSNLPPILVESSSQML